MQRNKNYIVLFCFKALKVFSYWWLVHEKCKRKKQSFIVCDFIVMHHCTEMHWLKNT